MSHPDWLPALVRLEDCGGDWEKYEQAVYSHFFLDFVESKPIVQGRRVSHTREPLVNGREYTFWHLISVGSVEENRLPDLRRCERIRWPKAVMDSCKTDNVRVWRNRRRNGEAVVLALPDWSYKVVLLCRRDSLLLWTAYPVEFANERRQMENEYQQYIALEKS